MFYEKVVRFCEKEQISIMEFEKKCNIGNGTIGKWEKGGKPSLDTLEKWLATEEREHIPSLMALHIFCLALGSASPLGAWLSIYGCDVMTPTDRRLRDYGRICIEDKKRAGGKRSLEKRILEDLK